MNTIDKKMYLIPETETLSLESMHSLMESPGNGFNDPNISGGPSAPGRKPF